MPITEIEQDRGYMGDRRRGASLGRGTKSASATIRYLKNEIASIQSAGEMFGDMLAGRRSLGDWTRDQVAGYAENSMRDLAEARAKLVKAEASPQDAQQFYLQRVRLDSGGYDSGGAYWGCGSDLWRYESQDGFESGYLWANNRAAAKAKVLEQNPEARFFK